MRDSSCYCICKLGKEWTEEALYHGRRRYECVWVFRPSGPPTGNTLNDMMRDCMQLRDKEFAAHVCALEMLE
jgi:hypothetical protein